MMIDDDDNGDDDNGDDDDDNDDGVKPGSPNCSGDLLIFTWGEGNEDDVNGNIILNQMHIVNTVNRN